jgi:murein DD-endopeptidase MepM/ murein hydrolase activator NlpD
MKEKFLSKESFERQSFVEWMRTGRYYTYEDYLRYIVKLERKSKWLQGHQENFIEGGTVHVQWHSAPSSKNKDDETDDESIEDDDSCDECMDLHGQIFEEGSAPRQPHPNCNCFLEILDSNEKPTGKTKKPEPYKKEEETAEKEESTSDIITSRYGKRRIELYNREERMHRGVDFAKVPKGTPIVAVKGGIISESRLSPSFGNKITIEHSDGTRTIYAHMEDLSSFKVGDIVNENDVIGKVGETGESEGVHLHYQREERNESNKWESFKPKPEEVNFLVDHFEKYRYKR